MVNTLAVGAFGVAQTRGSDCLPKTYRCVRRRKPLYALSACQCRKVKEDPSAFRIGLLNSSLVNGGGNRNILR